MGWLSEQWNKARESDIGRDVKRAYEDLQDNFHDRDSCGEIHEAAKRGDNESIGRLVESHGNNIVNKLCNDDESPLTFAVREGNVGTIRLLLHFGAKVDQQDSTGKTALYEAARHDQPDAVEILIVEGRADVNANDYHYFTALHEALKNNFQNTAKMLVKYNASLYSKDDDGRTPIDVAEDKDFANSLKPQEATLETDVEPLTVADISQNFPIHVSFSELLFKETENSESSNEPGFPNVCEIVNPKFIELKEAIGISDIHDAALKINQGDGVQYIMNNLTAIHEGNDLSQLSFADVKLAYECSNTADSLSPICEGDDLLQLSFADAKLTCDYNLNANEKIIGSSVEASCFDNNFLMHDVDFYCNANGECEIGFDHAFPECIADGA